MSGRTAFRLVVLSTITSFSSSGTSIVCFNVGNLICDTCTPRLPKSYSQLNFHFTLKMNSALNFSFSSFFLIRPKVLPLSPHYRTGRFSLLRCWLSLSHNKITRILTTGPRVPQGKDILIRCRWKPRTNGIHSMSLALLSNPK